MTIIIQFFERITQQPQQYRKQPIDSYFTSRHIVYIIKQQMTGKTRSNCQLQAGIFKSQHMKEQQSVLDIAKLNRTLNEHSKAFLSHRKVIKISTYNVRTLKQLGKLHQLIDECINNDIDLVAVQEHRWQTQEQVSTHLEYIDETTWRFEYSSAIIEGQGE